MIPSMRRRWSTKNRMRIGRTATVEAAMISWYCVPRSPLNCCMPSWTTYRSRSWVTISGHKKRFQLARKKKIPSAAMIGRDSGSTILV